MTLNGRVLGSATGNGVESEDLRQLALLFLSTYSCVSVLGDLHCCSRDASRSELHVRSERGHGVKNFIDDVRSRMCCIAVLWCAIRTSQGVHDDDM